MNILIFRVLRQILLNQSILLDQLDNANMISSSMVQVATVDLIKEIDDSTGANDTKKSEIGWQKGDIAEIREGWDRAGDHLEVLAPAIFLGQWWVPVDDPEDGEKGPTYHKEAGLKRIPK